jgi:hypothetical protein
MHKCFDFFLFLAEPFGFGPISSSIALARQIKTLDPLKKCIFLGYGTSHQLAVRSNAFDEIYFTEELSEPSLSACNIKINNNNCMVVANTYPAGVAFAKQAKFACIFIDTLFWMWNQLPIELSDVERYYIEDFHCVNLATYRFGYSDKFKIVPPLIDVNVAPLPVTHPFLLVSLGGIDSSIYEFPVFYQKLIEYISKEEKLEKYTILICGGGKKFRENEFKRYENPRLTITCLGPHEYISNLKAADIVLASAGLHGFYENYFLKKNVMFLPPQSYSQYLQLKFIMENFEGVVGTNFEELEISHNLRENMPELERIHEVKRTNKLLVDERVLKIFLKTLEKFYTGHLQTDWLNEKNKFEENQDGPLVLANEILSYAGAARNFV